MWTLAFFVAVALPGGVQASAWFETSVTLCENLSTACKEGFCKQDEDSSSGSSCVCPDEFPECEIPVSSYCGIFGSQHWFCVNGGECRIGADSLSFCDCLEEFTGPHCEMSVGRLLQGDNNGTETDSSGTETETGTNEATNSSVVESPAPSPGTTATPSISPTSSAFPTSSWLPTSESFPPSDSFPPTESAVPTDSALPTITGLPTGTPVPTQFVASEPPTSFPSANTSGVTASLEPSAAPVSSPTLSPTPKPQVVVLTPAATPPTAVAPQSEDAGLQTGATIGIVILVVVFVFFAICVYCRKRGDRRERIPGDDLQLSTNNPDKGAWANKTPLTVGVDDQELI